jgi:hypothetical protein
MIPDHHRPWAAWRDQPRVENGQQDVASGAAGDGHRGHDPLPPHGATPRDVMAPLDRLRRGGALAAGGLRIIAGPGLMAPGLSKQAPVVGGDLWQEVANVHAVLWAVGALWRDGAARFVGEASGAGAGGDSWWGDGR